MIILNEIKAFFSDKVNLSFMFAFPIVLIFLLGNLLSTQDYADASIGELRIGYMIKTTNQVEVTFAKEFIESVSEEGTAILKEMTDERDAKLSVANNELEGFTIFGEDEILIYEGKDQIKNRTITALFTGYSNLSKAVKVIANSVPDKLNGINTNVSSFVEEKEFNANRSMLDYYGVSMIIMMAFIGSIIGAGTFGEEIRLRTVNRLIVAPVSRTKIFFQKVIGQIPSAIIEIVVVMFVSVAFFNVHYAKSLGDNLILFTLFLLTSFTMLIIGVVIGLFIQTNPMLLIIPVLWVMMFLSGTFSKQIFIKGVSDRMPVYQLQQAAFDITVFGRTNKALTIILIEITIIILMTIIGVIRFNKLKEAR
jgi:ABC-2 type transport system permease protein